MSRIETNFDDLIILYVEDEDGARENMMYYLTNSFKSVYSASNGYDGLETFKKADLSIS